MARTRAGGLVVVCVGGGGLLCLLCCAACFLSRQDFFKDIFSRLDLGHFFKGCIFQG